MSTGRNRTAVITAILFLLPNLLGFLTFTFFPVILSFFGSFTTWSLRPSVPLEFIGLDNFIDMLTDGQFYYYLYNTVYLMLALPITIAGSLFLAVFLSSHFRFETYGARSALAGMSLLFFLVIAAIYGLGGSADGAYLFGFLGLTCAIGLRFGSMAYRVFYYLPHFTAGAATILLWTQLYNPNYGLINQAIENFGSLLGQDWSGPRWLTSTRSLLGFLPLPDHFNNGGFGLGAREAIMLMGIWAGIGGNNMILYLAAISNIPPELYEAADIDWQKFRHITFPQLAPTTFFIVVMGVIMGLQGGFEQARLMTEGGPAGSTTTLAYYIYTMGFQRLDLGYGSAVAWVLFILIFSLTLVNWKYGSSGSAD
jgi:multiple sugar transport system permease protein